MSTVPLHIRVRNKTMDIWHHLRIRVVGTKANEKDWRNRGPEQFYWSSIHHPHRAMLVKAVSDFSPTSVLEIGCNSGPNLYRLATECQGIQRMEGIDLNEGALKEGQQNLRREGIDIAHLKVGKADDLSEYEDRSFDVVISDAVMIYIGNDKIIKVRDEMLRVAKKGIVLVEWHDADANSEGRYLYKKGYWVRNYRSLFQSLPNVGEIRMTKILREQWNDDMWCRYGHVIEVWKK